MSRLLVRLIAKALSLVVEVAFTDHRGHDPGRQDGYCT
jgi:hypothetical protein